MKKATKKARPEAQASVLEMAEAMPRPRKGWFALLPEHIALELIEAKQAIKTGKSTACIAHLHRCARKKYPNDIVCSESCFRSWFSE
jgi:hypothetical protein